MLVCVRCEQPFSRLNKVGPIPKFCSAKCRRLTEADRWKASGRYEQDLARRKERRAIARPMRDCEICGIAFPSARRRLTCDDPECKRVALNHAQRDFRARYKAEHGVDYIQERYGEKRKQAKKAAGYTQSKRAADQRRRALKKGATVEKFAPEEVYERDGWVCGICCTPIDRGLSYPHPESVSLDHIQPLSLGGEHSRANARASHLVCNTKRGNKVA